jgi:hypothetical protein
VNDDEYGSRLLNPLRGEPAGPPAIDVVRAMREGRRMRSRRWWAGGSALAALLAAGLTGGLLVANREPEPSPIRPAACTAAALPIGKHRDVEVTGADPSGAWIVGTTAYKEGGPTPNSILVWHNGELVTDVKPTELRKGSDGVRMADINASGIAVGANTDGYPDPYVIEGGKIRKLAGGLGEADAINDAGVIVGKAGPPNQERPVRWTSPDADPVPLPLPDDPRSVRSRVTDITPDGTVIGTINWKAYLWRPDGAHGYLETPAVEGRRVNGFTPMVQREGWLYGALHTAAPDSKTPSRPPNGRAEVYRYELSTGAWQKVTDDWKQAQLAGAGPEGENPLQAEPKIYVGQSVLELPPLAPPAPLPASAPSDLSPGGSRVDFLSDDARVAAGTATDFRNGKLSDRRSVPVIWRCR